MIRFRPYAQGDVAAIEYGGEGKIPPAVDDLARSSWAFSGLIDGRIVACGGLLRPDPWRAVAWALFARGIPRRAWPAIADKCALTLTLAEADGIHCVEAEVAARFFAGHRFARHLGFRFAGFVPGRAADGGLFLRYARTTAAAEWPSARTLACLDLTDRTFADVLLREAA